MMTRLIDKMDADILKEFLDSFNYYNLSDAEVRQHLERLFAIELHWSAGLDPKDDQSWVFCFVSDKSPEDTSIAAWIAQANCVGYRCRHNHAWKYAMPIDLNVRFKEGD
jgi:hypothetical protein|tara:strand:- start:2288 stop:2614 length:327 start_codon:yes stop_codon:yes gene_type:complete